MFMPIHLLSGAFGEGQGGGGGQGSLKAGKEEGNGIMEHGIEQRGKENSEAGGRKSQNVNCAILNSERNEARFEQRARFGIFPV